ncbi:MAG TPA: hypothetical protein VHE30_09865, partial [Polyangiaceae bacterium]|nr:hypothetical protein [Polyangiaceae bacterium]
MTDSRVPPHLRGLRAAETLFAARRAEEALAAVEESLAEQPDFYWALLLHAKILRWLGRAAWLPTLERAVAAGAPENFGAAYELASHRLMHGDVPGAAPLVERALQDVERSEAKIWYFGGLTLLEALVRLASGDLARADRSFLRAFEFRRDTDETPLVWPLEPPRRGPSVLLEYRDLYRTMRLAGIDYEAELAKLPDDTTVLEIGAMDGVRFDPLRRFLTER